MTLIWTYRLYQQVGPVHGRAWKEPYIFMAQFITPRLRKADLDAADVNSYRPISDLSVASKLLERLAAK